MESKADHHNNDNGQPYSLMKVQAASCTYSAWLECPSLVRTGSYTAGKRSSAFTTLVAKG